MSNTPSPGVTPGSVQDESESSARTEKTTHPARLSDQFDDAPSTAYEYANGDRGDKSGVNLEQDAAIRGRPGDGLPGVERAIIDDRPAITPRNPDGNKPR
ncbi:MAG: hypothetical protein JWQ88_1606 [Rhodoferax sp.]|nr:hypothetical protein [Rhodoferax sp.]